MNESLPSFEIAAREHERTGNTAVANGLTRIAKHAFRRADAVRREGLMAGDFCKRCGASGGMHYGACTGEPAPYEQPGSIKFGEPQTYDLYRQGRLSCAHVFRPWETSGGAVERDGKLFGEFYFEACCKNCDARVGRRMEVEVIEQ